MEALWAFAGLSRRRRIPGAAALAVLACCALSASGCKSRPDPAHGAGSEAQRPRPLGGGQGRVVQVQSALRFVVIDFSLNAPPAPDQVLKVFRNGQPVAEVKAGRISRDATIAADILSGEPMPNDEVRPE